MLNHTTTVPQTSPTLLGINHDGPIRMTELGTGHDGLIWTVQPENHQSAVEFINSTGGPHRWKIEPL